LVRSLAVDGERDRMSDQAFTRLGWVIIAVATVTFAWFLTIGTGDLFVGRGLAEFFDLQARAIAHGHLAVPDGSLGPEGFVVGGRTYAYFGVFPSALRLPIFAITDRLDGRLSASSMLVAYVLAVRSCLRLLRGVRFLARPGTAWTRTGAIAALVTVALFALGSNLLFLASAAWVYHEAALWGAAGALASFAAIVSYLRRPRWQAAVAAGAWATVAWLSRGSVGLGPSVALGLIGLDHLFDFGLIRALAPRPPTQPEVLPSERGQPEGPARGEPEVRLRSSSSGRRRLGLVLLGASAFGAVAFGVVNTAKFGSPTVLPLDKQVGSQDPRPERARAMKAYHGTLFSKSLIPATVAQSLRPDVVALTPVFPYLRFTHVRPFDLGRPVFDTVEPTTGLTVTEPALLLGAATGVALAFRPRRRHQRHARTDGLRALRPLLLGAAVGALTPFTIAFIAQRYLTDVFPFLAVGVVATVAAIDRWSATSPPVGLRPALAVAMALSAAGVATTISTTWSFQHLEIPPTAAVRADALRTQANVGRHLGRPPAVRRGSALPSTVVADTVFVVGRCDGVYYGQPDQFWSPVERRAGVGVHRFRVPARDLDGADVVTVASVGEGTGRLRFILRVSSTGRAAAELHRGGSVVRGDPFRTSPGEDLVLDVNVDPNGNSVVLRTGDREVLFTFGPAQVLGPVVVGPGVREVPIPMPTCEALTRAR